MRRKAVRSIIVHTKDSIQHLKDDDDEMLRGKSETSAVFICNFIAHLLQITANACLSCHDDLPCEMVMVRQVPLFTAECICLLLIYACHYVLASCRHVCSVLFPAKGVSITQSHFLCCGFSGIPCLNCHISMAGGDPAAMIFITWSIMQVWTGRSCPGSVTSVGHTKPFRTLMMSQTLAQKPGVAGSCTC